MIKSSANGTIMMFSMPRHGTPLLINLSFHVSIIFLAHQQGTDNDE